MSRCLMGVVVLCCVRRGWSDTDDQSQYFKDTHPNCESWANHGECENNPPYMLSNCKRSCTRVRHSKRAKTRPRVIQSDQQVETAISSFRECSGLAASASVDSAEEYLGEQECLAACEGHTDCISQCQELSPRSLHRLLRPCAPWQYISNVSASWGMHVMCVLPAPRDCPTAFALLVIFANGRHTKQPLVSEVTREVTTLADFVGFCDRLMQKPTKGQLYQSSGVFTPMGVRLLSIEELLQNSFVIFQEGGQWVWPGVRIGHETRLRGLRHPDEVTIIRTVSLVPGVFEIENFLKPEESEHIIGRVRDTVQKSGVALKDVDKGKEAIQWRTSAQRFLNTENDATLQMVDLRVQALTGIPITHAESIQVLRYNLQEHYSAHHDFFNPADYASDPHVMNMIQHGATNRLATVFFYLTNVTRGGETNFPMAGGLPSPRDFFDCSRGYSSFPMANKVIIFYSMLPSGEMDEHSLHGGCDVLEGQKWSANFWLWNKPNPDNSHHEERLRAARLLGAVGDPSRKEVKFSVTARDDARGSASLDEL